jgi:hypothetical protein
MFWQQWLNITLTWDVLPWVHIYIYIFVYVSNQHDGNLPEDCDLKLIHCFNKTQVNIKEGREKGVQRIQKNENDGERSTCLFQNKKNFTPLFVHVTWTIYQLYNNVPWYILFYICLCRDIFICNPSFASFTCSISSRFLTFFGYVKCKSKNKDWTEIKGGDKSIKEVIPNWILVGFFFN